MAEIRMPDRPTDERDGDTAKETGAAKASIKQPTTRQKIKRAFIADEINDVKSYALFDVVIPSIKRVIRDLIMNAIDMTFYGRSKASRDPRDDRDSTYVDYRSAYRRNRDRDYDDRDRRDNPRSRSVQQVGVRELDRVVFAEKADAIDALSFVLDNIEEYGAATVADFLSCARLETSPIHSKWGWYDAKGASVRECPDGSGYYVDLPKPRNVQ